MPSDFWYIYSRAYPKAIHKCALCCTKENLTIHHKLPQALFPELKYDPENMVILCRKDHDLCEPESDLLHEIALLKKELAKLSLENMKLKTELEYSQYKFPKQIKSPIEFDKEKSQDRIRQLEHRVKSLMHLDGQDLYLQTLEQRVRNMIEFIQKNLPDVMIPDQWQI